MLCKTNVFVNIINKNGRLFNKLLNMKNKYIGLIFLIVLMSFDYSFGQNFTKKSIKLGLGVGIHMGNNTGGSGLVYTVGFQKEIWKDRLRFNPNFSIGQYSSKVLPKGGRDQHFNSLSLDAKLFFDLIKIESFSFVVGCGGFLNNTRGLIGTGGDPDDFTGKQESEYVNQCRLVKNFFIIFCNSLNKVF